MRLFIGFRTRGLVLELGGRTLISGQLERGSFNIYGFYFTRHGKRFVSFLRGGIPVCKHPRWERRTDHDWQCKGCGMVALDL